MQKKLSSYEKFHPISEFHSFLRRSAADCSHRPASRRVARNPIRNWLGLMLAVGLTLPTDRLHAQQVQISGDVSPSPAISPNWNIPGTLAVGVDIFGSLTILDGGAVSNTSGSIALNGASTGLAQVSGGTWTNSGTLRVGEQGSGTLQISGTGAVSNTNGVIGFASGATGLAQVSGGTWTSSNDIYVGDSGNGTLEISGTGAVSNLAGYIGTNPGSTGLAQVSGGTWANNTILRVGNLSNGTLQISGTGAVSNTTGFIGWANGTTGLAQVSGGTWTNSSNLFVGNSGNGTLEISGTGAVSNTNSFIGLLGGSTGLAQVTGGTWTNSENLIVGNDGNGTLLLSGTGAIFSANGFIAGLGSTGLAQISGGTWTNSGELIVGSAGNGTLEISGTGAVSASSVILANGAVSTGALSLLGGTLTAGQVSKGAGTGTVAFNGGTLRLSSNQANLFSGFSPGNVTLEVGGGTIDTQGFAVASSYALSGNGGLTKEGSGILTLTSNNTYTGTTTINNGILRTENASALGTGGVALTGGTLEPVGTLSIHSLDWTGGTIASVLGMATSFVDISTALTLSGGGGGFEFTPDGGWEANTPYLILSASNLADTMLPAFSGNTVFGLAPTFSRSGSDLFVNFLGATTGPLLQNSGLVFTPTDADFIVAGRVRTGSPNDNNTVNSLIFRDLSSLQVFNTLTVTSGNFSVPNGRATISGGFVSVPGNFNKNGAGTLVANSNFGVGGAANINAGALLVNGTFSAPGGLTVFQNALLGGSGRIIANVLNLGTVNPGNSPGTLTIDGNFTQASSGKLQIEVASPSLFDRLLVSGRARLAGTLEILGVGKTLKYGQQYPFLQAGSIEGEFDRILMPNPSRFRGRFLNSGTLGTLLVAPTSYTLVAKTPNQQRVAKALDSYIPARNNDREAVSIALDLQTEDQYPASFDQIAPTFHESLANIAIEQAFAQTQMLNQRLSSVRLGAKGFQVIGMNPEPLIHDKDGKSVADPKEIVTAGKELPWSFWAMGMGMFSKTTHVGNVPNLRFDSGGFLTGADYTIGGGPRGSDKAPSLSLGAYAGYNYTYGRYEGGGSTQVNSALFGGYAAFGYRGFYADAVVGGGFNGYKVRRNIEFSTIDRTARSTPNGGQFSTALNLGYDWQFGGLVFGPIAGVQYTYAGIAPFTETGADSLDLRLTQQNANSIRSTLGGRIAYIWNLTENVTIIPEVRMFWQHEFLNNPRVIGASLDGGAGPGFDYVTAIPTRDSVFAGAGLTAQLGERWNTFFFYNVDFGRSNYTGHSISGGLGFQF